jgi:hypothetical protein
MNMSEIAARIFSVLKTFIGFVGKVAGEKSDYEY